jgi:hypothetical protein
MGDRIFRNDTIPAILGWLNNRLGNGDASGEGFSWSLPRGSGFGVVTRDAGPDVVEHERQHIRNAGDKTLNENTDNIRRFGLDRGPQFADPPRALAPPDPFYASKDMDIMEELVARGLKPEWGTAPPRNVAQRRAALLGNMR